MLFAAASTSVSLWLGSTLVGIYVSISVVILWYTYQKLVMEPIIHRMLMSCLEPPEEKGSHYSFSAEDILKDHTNLSRKSVLMMSPFPTPAQEEREQALLDYKLTIEFKHLKSHAPGGVYLVPSFDNLRLFYGVIFVRRGPYTNGIFKFTLTLPQKYNNLNQHPEIRFISTVYSPYVELETGLLDLKTPYPRWDPARHYLVTVLTYTKKIFYAKDFEDAKANPEAKALAQTNPTEFRTKVDQCVRESQKNVYDNSPEDSSVQFNEEALTHRVLRDLLKANIKDPTQISKNTILAMIDKASKV